MGLQKQEDSSLRKSRVIKYSNHDNPYGRVRQVDGNYMDGDSTNIIGYCHNLTHRGVITAKSLKEHDCLAKNCTFLEKNADHPYWSRLQEKQEQKRKNKEDRKLRKILEERRRKRVRETEEEYVARANQIADELSFDNLKIISIHRTYPGCTIFYISDKPEDDWYEFRELAFAMSREFRRKFVLKHVKKPDGTYYTR